MQALKQASKPAKLALKQATSQQASKLRQRPGEFQCNCTCVLYACVCVTECWHNVMFAGCLEVRCSCVVLNGAAELEHVCNGKS